MTSPRMDENDILTYPNSCKIRMKDFKMTPSQYYSIQVMESIIFSGIQFENLGEMVLYVNNLVEEKIKENRDGIRFK